MMNHCSVTFVLSLARVIPSICLKKYPILINYINYKLYQWQKDKNPKYQDKNTKGLEMWCTMALFIFIAGLPPGNQAESIYISSLSVWAQCFGESQSTRRIPFSTEANNCENLYLRGKSAAVSWIDRGCFVTQRGTKLARGTMKYSKRKKALLWNLFNLSMHEFNSDSPQFKICTI